MIGAGDAASRARPTFTLDAGHIDLWLAYTEDLSDDAQRTAYRGMLTAEEALRERRFHFQHDRDLYLLSRALTRAVLGQYCGAPPGNLAFAAGPYGRPTLTSPQSSLVFNLSHTRGLVALAVGYDRELGVDVETLQRQNLLDVADRFFASTEVVDLQALPEERRHERFFEFWTLKESYIKARGMGLQLPLDKFAFHFWSDSHLRFEIHPMLGDHADRWSFVQFRADPAFMLALCHERGSGAPPQIRVRRTTPELERCIEVELESPRWSRFGSSLAG